MEPEKASQGEVAVGSDSNEGLGVIYLAVNEINGEVDYEQVRYYLTEIPESLFYSLRKNWVWKPFKIVPLDA